MNGLWLLSKPGFRSALTGVLKPGDHLITSSIDRLCDPVYLDRFGFIPSGAHSSGANLPIGFARGGPMHDGTGVAWKNPRTNADMTAVGLTCAACHTGRRSCFYRAVPLGKMDFMGPITVR